MGEMFVYVARLRECYDLSLIGATSWHSALCNRAYRKSIIGDNAQIIFLNAQLREILGKAGTLSKLFYDGMGDMWNVKNRTDILTLDTGVLFPLAGTNMDFSETESAWTRVLDDTEVKELVSGRDPPDFTVYEKRFGVRTGGHNVLPPQETNETFRRWNPIGVKAVTVSLWTEKRNSLCALVGFPIATGLPTCKGDLQELLLAICSDAFREYANSEVAERSFRDGRRVEPEVQWHKMDCFVYSDTTLNIYIFRRCVVVSGVIPAFFLFIYLSVILLVFSCGLAFRFFFLRRCRFACLR